MPENGIIFVTAMAEKKLENDEVRYSAAYPTGAERFEILAWRSRPQSGEAYDDFC